MKRFITVAVGAAALVLGPVVPATAASGPPANCNGQFNSFMASTLHGGIAGITASQAHEVWVVFGVHYGKAVVYVGHLDRTTCSD